MAKLFYKIRSLSSKLFNYLKWLFNDYPPYAGTFKAYLNKLKKGDRDYWIIKNSAKRVNLSEKEAFDLVDRIKKNAKSN